MENFSVVNKKSMITSLNDFGNRLSKPVLGILEGFEWKFFCASFFVYIQEYFYKLFKTDPRLILSLFVLMFIDFITGVYASLRAKKQITSLGFRSTIIKAIEYIFLLGSITIVGNMSPSLDWIVTWSYIFLCLTELKSIAENIPNTHLFFKKLWQAIKSKNNIDVE